MSTVQSKEIGSHVFSVRPFNGARAEAASRILTIETHRIFTSRLGLQSDSFAQSVNRDAFLKIRSAVICPDHTTVRVNGAGPERPMTEKVWDETVPEDQLMAVIAFAALVNFAPEMLPFAA